MIKLLVLFAGIFCLSGCSEYSTKTGDCFFSVSYDTAIKVTKVEKYGMFFQSIERPKTVWLKEKPLIYRTGYLDWHTLSEYGSLIPVDCDAYDSIPKKEDQK